jgi:hypothetical protein
LSSAEDIRAELGEPMLLYYKEDDRITIHAPTRSDNSPSNDCQSSYFISTNHSHMTDFMNYFNHGIDFLMDGSSHILKKIILHSNTVNTFDNLPWRHLTTYSSELLYFNAISDVHGGSLPLPLSRILPTSQVYLTKTCSSTYWLNTSQRTGSDIRGSVRKHYIVPQQVFRSVTSNGTWSLGGLRPTLHTRFVHEYVSRRFI